MLERIPKRNFEEQMKKKETEAQQYVKSRKSRNSTENSGRRLPSNSTEQKETQRNN
jgi:hypothetical protein